MQEVYDVTSASESPGADRERRTRSYTISMMIRFVCVFLVFVLPGWWAAVALLGAAILPLFAVLIANNVEAPQNGENKHAYNPNTLDATPADAPAPTEHSKSSHVIVIDAPAERKPTGVRITEGDE